MTARVILASASPRRQWLLASAGLKFEVIVSAVEECSDPAFSIRELTTRNATRKALALARIHPEAVVLGADTLVALGGEAIGKPADLREARDILRRLSGREHQVCTSVYIGNLIRGHTRSFHVISHVQFRSLTDAGIRDYLAKINPLDKAGAYAAQGHGSDIIRRIRGSYTNVVGLPMDETLAALAQFGIV